METAPLWLEIAEAPDTGAGYWVRADDGLRLRIGVWVPPAQAKGTILVFPGRTEYIEKHGRTVARLHDAGFASIVIDWRGQGASDRMTDDRQVGHVRHFADYQRDVAAMVEAATALGLPKPWFFTGHSLGACIGLRALSEGLRVSACAFTAPMWGINLPPRKRAVAWPAAWLASAIGKGDAFAPGTGGQCYVLANAFDGNRLTRDPEMYAYFIRQAEARGDLQIGGPSLGWLLQALGETRRLMALPCPDIPCVTYCGTADVVVDIPTIQQRMAHWADGTLHMIEGARHDMLCEMELVRDQVISGICNHFGGGSGPQP